MARNQGLGAMTQGKENRVEAVERALTILEAFHEDEEILSLSDLAQKTGLYKSTILRLAGSLERFGYLTRESDGRFHLGPSLWRLGLLYRRGYFLGEYIRPQLRRLRDATLETASYYIRDGNQRVCLYRLNSPQSIRHHLDEGIRLPLDHGAGGKVLLAFSGEPGDEFERIRSQGFYASLGERDRNIGAVAVPVFDRSGRLRGALSISALITRFDEAARSRAVTLLRESADLLRATIPQG